ncbi:hypothetical protein [Altererythrobacter sp. MTPC7]|uniref:hypothetical protein n=1 Tax=Altererythrobacter sp. MTPC7 TaxID=3056567 RepID=UPI0036F2BC2D
MAKAIDDRRRNVSGYDQAHGALRDWRKSMSDNVAYALLVYTALQIFVSVAAMKEGTSSILPCPANSGGTSFSCGSSPSGCRS